jgi:hypothetical protein
LSPNSDGLLHRPRQSFARTPPPPEPDYADAGAWAAWPGRGGFAEDVPKGVATPPPPEARPADVFFVHPTTYLSGLAWNARFDEPGPSATIVDLTLRNQASAFNGACRVFALRYRQASAIAFTMTQDAQGISALNLAYGDVLRAFDHYIAQENHGRPFILAAHSQGSMHLLRLAQERVIGAPLQRQLVAAYLVGAAVPKAIERLGLPICRDPAQTGCVVSWNSLNAWSWQFAGATFWLDGRYRTGPERLYVSTNPLSWKADGAMPSNTNLGALPGVSLADALPAPVVALTGARCSDGRLIVRLPLSQPRGFRDAATLLGNYHLYDYSLFWMNIRKNVALRVKSFLGGASA